MKPPIRWTLQQAGAEFGIDPATLSNRLRAASIAAGDDKRFSTRQIVTAIAGDLEKEKTRNEAAKADLNEMKRDLDARRLIPAGDVRAAMERLRAAISAVIAAAPLTGKQRGAIAGNLERLTDLFA